MPTSVDTIRENLTYEIIAPVYIILSDLEKIEKIAKYAQTEKDKYYKIARLSAVGDIISFILFIIIPKNIALVTTVLLVTSIILLVIVFYTLFMLSRLDFTIIKYRHESIKKVLQLLDRDVDKTATLKVHLSFQPLKKYKIKTLIHPHKKGWKIDKYSQGWLAIGGRFLDGNRFRLSMTELSVNQYGWKTSSSGKSKYKAKPKSIGVDIRLVVNYSKRKYGSLLSLEKELANQIQLPKSVSLKNVKMTDKNINLLVRISASKMHDSQTIYQTVLMMLLSLYQTLNLAKIIPQV